MKKIVLFNHKGGVSKTTTSFHLAWMLSTLGKKVCMVDADSQTNLTGLTLGDDFDKYFLERGGSENDILASVSPVFENKPEAIKSPNLYEVNDNLFLLAGNPEFTRYERVLNLAISTNAGFSALNNVPGSFDNLFLRINEEYSIDVFIIDLNPSLSSLNHVLFSTCDYFLTPTNPDVFSTMALKTLSNTIPMWVESMRKVKDATGEVTYPLGKIDPKFLGLIIQRFNIRGGKPTNPYQGTIDNLKTTLTETFVPKLKEAGFLIPSINYENEPYTSPYVLAEVPDFQSIGAKHHSYNLPIFELTDEHLGVTGPPLTQMQQKREVFRELYHDMSSLIACLV